MKRRHLFASVYRMDEGINISPLIDVVFILLLFFIVSSVFQEQESVEIRKPEAQTSRPSPNEPIYIAVTKDGQISMGGKSLSLGGVGPALQRMSRAANRPVVVQVDREVTAELLIRVVDQVRLTGNESVHVATLPQ